MDFQEQMQNTLRTKDEVQEEAIRNLMQKIESEACRNYECLKKALLNKAEKGDYSIEYGRKVFKAIFPSAFLYSEYKAIGQKQQWFTAQITDRSIQAVRDRKTRREITPYQFHNVVHFSLCPDAGQRLYMKILNQLGAADGIQISFVLYESGAYCNSYQEAIYSLPCTQYDMRESRVKECSLSIQGIYRVPGSNTRSEVSSSTAADVHKSISYKDFVHELDADQQRVQEEEIRAKERAQRLAAEKAKTSDSESVPPASVSLLSIFCTIGGFVMGLMVISQGNAIPGLLIMLVGPLLGMWLLKNPM